MKYISFSDKEKVELFDRICKHFYYQNFGQMSKADIELMMFNFYIQKMVSENSDNDGVINYNNCSDYRISKELGITQQRVRNLKVKNQLVNPVDYDWKKALAKLTANARYDSTTNKISLSIPDPNLFYEIQNFIEENGAYVEKQLNSKILQIRVEYYIDLIISLENDTSKKKIIKSLRKQFKEANKSEDLFDESNIGKSLIEGALNITTVAANISTIANPQNCLISGLMALLQK